MKGLILKDIYEVRFQVITGALIALYPNILLTIGIVDMGMDLSPAVADIACTAGFGMISYFTIVPFTSLILNTLSGDISSGWAKIRRTMPVSPQQIIASKLISTGIIIGLFTLLSLIFGVIMLFLYPDIIIPEFVVSIPLCVGVMQVLTLSLVFPFATRFGAKKANTLYLAVTIIIAIAAIIFVFASFENIAINTVRLICYLALPAAAFLSVFLSYKSGKKLVSEEIR